MITHLYTINVLEKTKIYSCTNMPRESKTYGHTNLLKKVKSTVVLKENK